MRTILLISACLSSLLGVCLSLGGIIGLFGGIAMHFTLPPIAGVIPLFVGFGILYPLFKWWKWEARCTVCANCRKERFDLKPGTYRCSCGNIIEV